jgi:hypothetical protein
MKAGALLLVGSCLAAGCSKDDRAPTPAGSIHARPPPESWTLGAAPLGGMVLPPGCREREVALRAVLGRSTRLSSDEQTLGSVVVAEGTLAGGGDASFRADAAGVMTMSHGPTAVEPVAWSDSGATVVARAESEWLVLARSGSAQYLWRQSKGTSERVPTARADAVDLRCRGARCAILAPSPESPSAAVVWLGAADTPLDRWDLSAVEPACGATPCAAARPLGIARLDERDGELAAVVAIADELRIHFLEAWPGKAARPLAALSAPNSVLDTTATPVPAALLSVQWFGKSEPSARCQGEDGGAWVVWSQQSPVRLRAPVAAQEGTLTKLPGGWLALWLAPVRCGALTRMLYAALLRDDGSLFGPVTAMAAAERYALAAVAGRIDLWIVHDDTVSWARVACALK